MKKIILGTFTLVALAATIGAGAAKAAWDSNVEKKSVTVNIGTSSDIKNAKFEGGDLTKALIPSGAVKGTNDTYELDLGTLTFDATSKTVDADFAIFADGKEVSGFEISWYWNSDSSTDSDNVDIIKGENEHATFSSGCNFKLAFIDNSGDISDDIVNAVKGKTLTLQIILTSQK